ncbi:MAG: AAA family ATPase [Dermatophilaceae bacterium]
MAGTVGDRVGAARRRAFVGREAELAVFDRVVHDPQGETAVLFVHGPGGVGKSTLLRRLADECHGHGIPALRLDARDLAPTSDAITAALAPLTEPDLATSPTAAGRRVLFIDTFEQLAPLETMLRERVLSTLPADTLVVMAGQLPPSTAWLTDPGWSALIQTLPLANLSPAESDDYLHRRSVPPEQRDAAVAFTRGHPLALALVSEVVLTRGSFAPQQAPDVVTALVDQLMQAVPTAEHRRALEATSQVRVLTQPLLAALLEGADASGLFEWLRRLPIVELGPAGLRLHDLAVDVLDAELRWRDPLRYRALHDRARGFFLDRLSVADPAEQSAAMMDLIFLHQELRPYLQPGAVAADALRLDAATSADAPAIVAIIERHEGDESGAIAAAWLAAQPAAWSVVRAPDGTVAGLLCALAIEDRAALADVPDPAVDSAYAELARHAPLRAGERCTLIRFWMSTDGYQGVSPAQSLVAVQIGRHYVTTAGLAFSLLSFADPEPWAAATEYSDQHRMPAADFMVGGRRYTSFGHDWRVVSPADWLARLAMRETGTGQLPAPPQDPAAVLAREDFAAAVRRALRGLTRTDRLRASPLLTSRLVTSRVPAGAKTAERVEALREVLVGACRSLQGDPRAYRVLHRSFLAPAPTLEAAAEALGMPSSTFRRHLTSAVDRVVEVLWEQELGR